MNMRQMPVSFYGKLSLAKDFLRVNCSDPASSVFWAWLKRGSQTAELPSEAWWIMAPALFHGEGVVATVRPSADKGAGRTFLFSCFIHGELAGPVADLFASCLPTFAALESIDAYVSNLPDRGVFQREAPKATVPAPEPGPPPRLETPGASGASDDVAMTDWVAALFPALSADDASAAFADLLWSVRAAVTLAVREPARSPALCLPLACDLDPVPQARAWLACIQRSDAFADRPMTVMLSPSGPGKLCLLPRAPEPRDFLLLTRPIETLLVPAPPGGIKTPIDGRGRFEDGVRASLAPNEAALFTMSRLSLQTGLVA